MTKLCSSIQRTDERAKACDKADRAHFESDSLSGQVVSRGHKHGEVDRYAN